MTYHNTIKMKPIHVKSNTNIDSNKENNDQHPTFKIGDTIRISKYIKIFLQNVTLQIGLKKFL